MKIRVRTVSTHRSVKRVAPSIIEGDLPRVGDYLWFNEDPFKVVEVHRVYAQNITLINPEGTWKQEPDAEIHVRWEAPPGFTK